MADLYIMAGIPGSGKSTWAKSHLSLCDKYISRDEIRFSMVKEDEEYFAKEDEVFKEFCNQITAGLKNGYNVFADATHINKKSRNKLISNVSGYDRVFVIVMDYPLPIALEQNERRKGTRAYVPKSVIRRMYNQFEFPNYDEGFAKIYRVKYGVKEIEFIKERKEDL